jgi:hypothetical protein
MPVPKPLPAPVMMATLPASCPMLSPKAQNDFLFLLSKTTIE